MDGAPNESEYLPTRGARFLSHLVVVPGSMSLDDTTVAIVAAHEFEDIELEFPLLRLSEMGAEVHLVPIEAGHHPRPSLEAREAKPVTGRYGTPIPPDVLTEGEHYSVTPFEDLSVEAIDCVLLPGGFSPDHLRTEDQVVAFLAACDEAGVVIAAICHGPQLLVETDALEGREVTGVGPVRTDLANAGATVVDAPVAVDEHLVTGRNPDALPAFCRAIGTAVSERAGIEAASDD
jgi:protease I